MNTEKDFAQPIEVETSIGGIYATVKNNDNDMDHILRHVHMDQHVVTTIVVDSDKTDQFHSYLNTAWKMSNAEKVKQFTEESTGVPCPKTPRAFAKKEAQFLIAMVLSEVVEFAQTITDNTDEALELVKNSIGVDTNRNYVKPTDEYELIAQQADACVDAWYYMLNGAAKCGINLSQMFDEVHKANMSKRFPDGKFHRRDDNKVIKPESWKEPNVVDVIKQQTRVGSWAN
jgi:predicted HAD superfamily Cof-like phosphohydrolase